MDTEPPAAPLTYIWEQRSEEGRQFPEGLCLGDFR